MHMIRKNSLSVIAAAVFAALSTAAVAQTSSSTPRQSTGASQASQTNPQQSVNPSAATGVESSAQFRGNHNTIFMDSQATTNQSTTASQNTNSAQSMGVQSGVPGMNAVPGQGGTSSSAGGSGGSKVDMNDGPGKRGKGKAKGHDHAPGQN